MNTLTKGKTYQLVPIDVRDMRDLAAYVVEAKPQRKFPKLCRTPYFVRCFKHLQGDKTGLGSSSISFFPKEIKAAWEIRE